MKYFAIIIIPFFIYSCYGRKPKVKTGFEGKAMPTIQLLAVDSNTIYNTERISPGKPTLLFSFETWCPYCRAQTKSLVSNIESMNDINVYMICNTQLSEFKKFYKEFNLDKYPNIKAGVDYELSFERYFRTGKIPYLAMYDRNKILKQVIIGKTSIATLRKIMIE